MAQSKSFPDITYKIFLLLLFSFIFITNFIWLKKDALPPQGNGLNDLFPAINFYLDVIQNKIKIGCPVLLNMLSSPSSIRHFVCNTFEYIKRAFPLYPPFVPVSYSLFYLLFGPSTEMEIMVNSIILSIGLCAVYGIAKKMLYEKSGLLAAFVFSSFPGVVMVSRYTYAEFFSMCLVALTLFLLLKTDFLQSKKYSLLLGVSLGLTALTKWDFPPAVIGPFVLTLWRADHYLKKTKKYSISKLIIWQNLGLATLVGILIFGLWYFLNFKNVIWRFILEDENSRLNCWMSHDRLIHFSQLITFYPLTIINVHIKFFYFVLLVLVGIVFIYNLEKKRYTFSFMNDKLFYAFFLISWIVIPYICFTYTQILNPSHIMLILPALAVIIGIGVFSFKYKIIRIILITLIALFGFYTHLHSFFYFNKLEPIYSLKLYYNSDDNLILTTLGDETFTIRDKWEIRSFYPPDNRDWKLKDILSFIKEDSKKIGHKPVVLILIEDIYISFFQFQYYNLLGNYQLYIEPRGHDRSEVAKDRSHFDYVVINTDDGVVNETLVRTMLARALPNYYHHNYRWNEFITDFFQKNKFRLLKDYVLPNGSITKIYKLVENPILSQQFKREF